MTFSIEPSLFAAAVVTAGVAQFIAGGLWYSPFLLGEAWLKATGMTKEKIQEAEVGKAYVLSFVAGLITMSVLLVIALATGARGLFEVAGLGLGLGIGLNAMGLAAVSLFEDRSFKLYLITAGQQILCLAVGGGTLSFFF